MKGAVWIFFCIFFINIKCYSQTYDYITEGTEMRRGYLVDNVCTPHNLATFIFQVMCRKNTMEAGRTLCL